VEKRIKLEDCKHRGLYKLHSRNLMLGVYNQETQGFCGIREKFNSRYVFEEYHADYDGPYKTAHPMELLPDELPAELEPIEFFPECLCSVCKNLCEYAKFPDGEHEITMDDGFKMIVPGEWRHLDGSPRCSKMSGYHQSNTGLFHWLESMEEKYLVETLSKTP
jgi:hypothetical protein